MRSFVIVAAIVSAAVLSLVSPAPAQEAAGAKKLIEWGWDEPDTKFMRENVAKMEQFPFDGVIFHANSSKGGNFTWEMWGARKFELTEFQHAIDDLKATPFTRLTERFLRVNVAPGTVDWFDDAAFSVVPHNAGVAAAIAKQGGCRGFMFDIEQYNEPLFQYSKQKHRANKTFAEYQAKIRQRGREWMRAVNEQFPDITILLAYAYSLSGGSAKEREDSHYGLAADFLDGMLDACTPKTRLVDAWEGAYTYKRESQYQSAYESIKVTLAARAADPDRYRRHFTAGFGIWMDCNWREAGWRTDEVAKNFHPPADFEASVRAALKRTDQYVWIYTEQPKWWTNEKLPAAYVEALRRARESVK